MGLLHKLLTSLKKTTFASRQLPVDISTSASKSKPISVMSWKNSNQIQRKFSLINKLKIWEKFSDISVFNNQDNRDLKQRPRRQQHQRQKTSVFMCKTTALHVHHAFQYISLTSTARLRRETSQCDVIWRTWTYYDKFSFLYFNMDKALKNSTPGKVAYICRIERFQIDALKIESTQTHFLVMFPLPSSSSICTMTSHYDQQKFSVCCFLCSLGQFF